MSYETVRTFFALLALAANAATIVIVVAVVAKGTIRERVFGSLAGSELWLSFVVAATATLGSLYLSEIVHLVPCVFCWYQRIAMYPLVLILAIGLLPYDPRVRRYAAAFASLGWIIALFQTLLVAGIIPESAQPCVKGITCSETHISLLGFLNIPTLSLLTFTVIGVLLFYSHRLEPS